MDNTENLSTASPNWQQEVSDWQASTLSIADFCKQRDLVYHQFLYWKRKFSKQSSCSGQSEQTGFVKVHPAPMINEVQDITITLPGGILIRGVNKRNVDVLRSILEQL